ncbi:MAG: ATP-binding cassette domain-containing protein [Candidatus Electrothrix sp. ATG2]|nr:ATP-binding cassette domain-containing protein [Candidatus Electrothrix sp. ATG2]
MLELRNINSYYGNIQVLYDISLHVEQGEIITLIGANGAGKSTILMSICGIVPPRSGGIFFNGSSITQMPTDKLCWSCCCLLAKGWQSLFYGRSLGFG